MSPPRKKKWAGPLTPADLTPEQLARFRNFYERFHHYCKVLPTNPIGTGNGWQAYEAAVAEMKITDEERVMLKRLPLSETFPDVDERYR